MKKKKSIKVITILTVICAFVAVCSAFIRFLLPLYLANKFSIDARNAASIGIIGGADGPTAIFVSGQIFSYGFTAIFAALAVIGVIYLIVVKNSAKKS